MSGCGQWPGCTIVWCWRFSQWGHPRSTGCQVDNACDCHGHLLAVAQHSDSWASSRAFRHGVEAGCLVHNGCLWPLPGRALMIGDGDHRLQTLYAAGVTSSAVSGSMAAAARRLTLALQDVEDF